VHCIDHHRRAGIALAAGLALALAGCASGRTGRPSGKPPLHAEPPVHLGAPARLRSMNEVRVQAAMRIVDANPNGTYDGRPPDVLLAIPVLEVELNGNGSVRRIRVSRYPGQAPETTQMAIDAVHRAAPFGDVSHLPKPWVFTEVFLFRDDRRFKPRTLDN
jgi:hypothetical protein